MPDQMRRIGAEAFFDLAEADLAKARLAEAAASAGIYAPTSELRHNGVTYHFDFGRA